MMKQDFRAQVIKLRDMQTIGAPLSGPLRIERQRKVAGATGTQIFRYTFTQDGDMSGETVYLDTDSLQTVPVGTKTLPELVDAVVSLVQDWTVSAYGVDGPGITVFPGGFDVSYPSGMTPQDFRVRTTETVPTTREFFALNIPTWFLPGAIATLAMQPTDPENPDGPQYMQTEAPGAVCLYAPGPGGVPVPLLDRCGPPALLRNPAAQWPEMDLTDFLLPPGVYYIDAYGYGFDQVYIYGQYQGGRK